MGARLFLERWWLWLRFQMWRPCPGCRNYWEHIPGRGYELHHGMCCPEVTGG